MAGTGAPVRATARCRRPCAIAREIHSGEPDLLFVRASGAFPEHPRPIARGNPAGDAMSQGIWPAVLGRFDWAALPFVRAWEDPTASEIIGAGAASIVIIGAAAVVPLIMRT